MQEHEKKLFRKGKAGKLGFNLRNQIQKSLKHFLVIVGMWRSYEPKEAQLFLLLKM